MSGGILLEDRMKEGSPNSLYESVKSQTHSEPIHTWNRPKENKGFTDGTGIHNVTQVRDKLLICSDLKSIVKTLKTKQTLEVFSA